MFSKRSNLLFIVAAVLVLGAFLFMAFDPAPAGFGILTLWIAPPILLVGLFLPVIGILGVENLSRLWSSVKFRENKWKHLAGAFAFLTAFITYQVTLEPTASLWDCSEFIATSYKLQVPHTPGTPLSLLFGRLFSMLALDDVTKVAWYVNMMSAFFSSLAVFMVFHLIWYFGEKLNVPKSENLLLNMASLCGSLCVAFSDTFWFSAVEAEAYGPACFFLLLMVWLMLKGSDCDEPMRSRMFILIGYVAGLSYCVHPMCLLVMPVLPFVWYLKGRKLTIKNLIITIIPGLSLVLIVNRFIAVGVFQLGFSFDLFFVNTLRLPFYSGAIFLFLLFVTACWFLISRYPSTQTYTLSVIFLLAGFIPYAMLFIRSNHNPPIDETNPEDLYMMKAYMNRESYPSSPLVFGPYFDAQFTSVTSKNKAYYKDETDYKVAGDRVEYGYEKSRQTILPRLYSRDENHIQAYKQWLDLKPNEKPRFSDNLKFLFTYQLGHMYLRYFLWNFAGRESDVQNSAWLKPWERLSYGDRERARNQYWMIPLVLGMLGAVYHYRRDPKGFATNMIFFLLTGLVLALYLNVPPIEPRERDYIYAASYIAFSIWVGLSILSLHASAINKKILTFMLAIISIAVPAWMFYQNFDDHNRAGRTFQVDYAKSMLNSCVPNSILFTGGDNDTFPLWYLQEVEGFRTDVRVMVLSYFNTDWYINQLRNEYYNSPPFKLTLNEKDYRQYGLNDVLYIDEQIKRGIDVSQYLTLISNEHPALRRVTSNGDSFHILPSRTLTLANQNEKDISLQVNGNHLEKNALAILDLIVSNEWKRPLFFNFTSMNSIGLNVKPYLVQEGLVYRLTPLRHGEEEPITDTKVTFQKLIVEADYSNLLNERVYFNYEDYQARMITPLRQSFNALAEAFIKEGNSAMAEKVLLESVNKLYPSHLLPSYSNLHTADLLGAVGREDLVRNILEPAFDYYFDQVQADRNNNRLASNFDLYVLKQSAARLGELGETAYVDKINALGL